MRLPDSLIDLFHYNVINSRPSLRFSSIAFRRGPSDRPSVRPSQRPMYRDANTNRRGLPPQRRYFIQIVALKSIDDFEGFIASSAKVPWSIWYHRGGVQRSRAAGNGGEERDDGRGTIPCIDVPFRTLKLEYAPELCDETRYRWPNGHTRAGWRAHTLPQAPTRNATSNTLLYRQRYRNLSKGGRQVRAGLSRNRSWDPGFASDFVIAKTAGSIVHRSNYRTPARLQYVDK